MATQFFQQMFEKHSAMMLLIDPITGQILHSNLSANRFYGYTAAQMNHLNLLDINTLPAAEVMKLHEAAMQEECNCFIVPHRLASGEIRTVEVHASPIRWENQPILFAIIHDITERRRVGAALRAKQQQHLLRELFAAMPAPIFYLDRQGYYLGCNEAFAALVGQPIAEIIGQTQFDLWSEDVARKQHETDVALMVQLNQPQIYEANVYHATLQEARVFLITKSVVKDMLGEAVAIVGVMTDITEQKRLAAGLEQRLEIFQLLIQNHNAIMVLIDPTNGKIMESNPAASRFYGYTMTQMRGMNMREINQLSETELTAILQAAIRHEQNYFVLPHRLASGEIRIVEIHSSPIKWKNSIMLFSIIHDITARKQAEKALRENQQKLQTILESLPLGVSVLDSNNHLVYANRALEEHLRLSQEGLLRGDYHQRSYLQADGSLMLPENYATSRARREQQIIRNVETGIVQPNNGVIWLNVSAIPVKFSDWQLIVVTENITARKQAAEALQASERKFRLVMEAVAESIIVVDLDGQILLANTKTTQLFDYSKEELVGQSIDMLLPERYRVSHRQHRAAYFSVPETRRMGKMLDLTGRRKDGSEFPLEISLSYTQFDTGMVAIAFITDITERKQAEQALRESEERWQYALEGSGDGVWDWNVQTNHVFYSRRWKEMLGYADEEIKPDLSEWERLVHPDDKEMVYEQLAAHFRGETPYYMNEQRLLHQDGSYRWILARGKVMSWTADRQPLRMVGTHTDITEQKELEAELHATKAQLEQLAIYDPLTGVHNRVLLQEKLTHVLSQPKDRLGAILTIDLDEFKKINDIHGHQEGDRLLIEITARMKSLLRKNDTLIRLGGDEFLFIAPDVESLAEVENIAKRLLKAVRRQVQLANATVSPTLSIGIAMYPIDGLTSETLMVNSDRALYHAKNSGKNGYAFAHAISNDLVVSRVKRRFGAL